MIKALVLDCGRPLIKDAYSSSFNVLVDIIRPEEIENFEGYELVVIPSTLPGEKLLNLKTDLHKYLSQNGVVFCFSSSCINHLPQIFWDKSISIPSIHYQLYDDTYDFFKDVDIDILNKVDYHGWKSDGYLKCSSEAQIVVCSYEQLPVMVVDEVSTSGTMVVTAGLGLLENALQDVSDKELSTELNKIWENMIQLILQRNRS